MVSSSSIFPCNTGANAQNTDAHASGREHENTHLDDQHVDDARVGHVLGPVEHLAQLLVALLRSDVQLERVHWSTAQTIITSPNDNQMTTRIC